MATSGLCEVRSGSDVSLRGEPLRTADQDVGIITAPLGSGEEALSGPREARWSCTEAGIIPCLMNNSTVRASDGLQSVLETIHGSAFATHLREHGLASSTMDTYRSQLRFVARWLDGRDGDLEAVRREDVPRLLRDLSASGSSEGSIRLIKAAIRRWLKFRGRFARERTVTVHDTWVSDYLDFLLVHRGLKPSTRSFHERGARDYLDWQFGASRPHWSKVGVQDLWRYAERCARNRTPNWVRGKLLVLRRFLSFVHLRGACSWQLPRSLPKVADYGHSSERTVLTPQQRQQLLRGFDLRRRIGRRDYTLALLMVDLGLRVGEVAELRLDHIDWRRLRLTVPPTKTPRGRVLPLPRHVAMAMRAYIKQVRPPGHDRHLFVRHWGLIGRPMSVGSIRLAMILAYRRCGFPKSWNGTHILRRTFATDVHARGATMRQVADFLGHQRVATTGVYTQAALRAMRALAQPWPVSA